MCGDIEEEGAAEDHLFNRFLLVARRYAGDTPAEAASAGEREPLRADGLHAYMDGIFGETLRTCAADAGRAEPGDRLSVLGAQAVVLARAAGLLAAQLPAGGEPLRDVVEALMQGYAERDAPLEDHHHHHDHDDDHGHDHHHDHEHGHAHEHGHRHRH